MLGDALPWAKSKLAPKRSSLGETITALSRAKRQEMKEILSRRRQSIDAEFQECKKSTDKDLAARIRNYDVTEDLIDMSGQPLLHWCVVTERPLSVIALCSTGQYLDQMNVTDSRGRTALHVAATLGQEYMVSLLLNLGVSTDILDHSRMTPLHIAAAAGNKFILKTLLERTKNPNVSGDGGYTALHFAVAGDHDEVVQMLLDYKASMMLKSYNGTYPVHVAAKCGAAKSMEVLLNGAGSQGVDGRNMLNLRDREGQLPIHNAVNNGSTEVVIICLRNGSSLMSAKNNGITPVHYAAMQGNIELLETMQSFDSEQFKEALSQGDCNGRTPLHWATIFDHKSTVRYLIKMSDPNSFDTSSHTPLLSAANNACWDSLKIMLSNKDTNLDVLDDNQRNALHLAVRQKVNLQEMLHVWKSVRSISRLCNEEDKTGSTPLHYAVWNGSVSNVHALLILGAITNVKNKYRQNPFHIACRNGSYDVCIFLLNMKEGARLKNELDDAGQSPLHLAASKGYVNIVNLLLQRGAVMTKDKAMNSPLHLAARAGNVPTIRALLSVHLELLDLENVDGDTALHLAASNGHSAAVDLLLTAGAEVIYNNAGRCFFDDAVIMGYREVMEVLILHERWQEMLSIFSQVHGQLTLGLIHYLPLCCLMVLDRCVSSSSNDKHSKDYSVSYNFRYLQPSEDYAQFARTYKLRWSPLLPVEMMLQYDRDDCQRHVLVSVYLKQKWISYGRLVNFLDIGIYCIYMALLSMFVITHNPMDHYHTLILKVRRSESLEPVKDDSTGKLIYAEGSGVKMNETDLSEFDFKGTWFPPEAATYHQPFMVKLRILAICLYGIVHIGKQFVQAFTTRGESLRDIWAYQELATYVTSIYFVGPFLFGYSTHTQWQAAAITVFLSWFNFLVLCQRFDLVGLYIVMYIEIMKTLLQILFIFLVLLIAFGMAFYIMLGQEANKAHSDPLFSMYRTFIMMFELDFMNHFLKPYMDNKSKTFHFGQLTFFFLGLFMLFMALLLVNLMIGLAVGDIQSVAVHAHQQKLATQVNFHSKIERKLPFLSRRTPETLTIYPNEYNTNTLKAWFRRLIGCENLTQLLNRESLKQEKPSQAMQGLMEVRRELGQLKDCIKQIMRRMDIEDENYIPRDPMELTTVKQKPRTPFTSSMSISVGGR